MKTNKIVSAVILGINITGLICLIFFAFPYITHNTYVPYPDAMLPAAIWETAGMALTIGFIPLLIANFLGWLFIKLGRKYTRLLFFIPSVICLILVVSVWLPAFI